MSILTITVERSDNSNPIQGATVTVTKTTHAMEVASSAAIRGYRGPSHPSPLGDLLQNDLSGHEVYQCTADTGTNEVILALGAGGDEQVPGITEIVLQIPGSASVTAVWNGTHYTVNSASFSSALDSLTGQKIAIGMTYGVTPTIKHTAITDASGQVSLALDDGGWQINIAHPFYADDVDQIGLISADASKTMPLTPLPSWPLTVNVTREKSGTPVVGMLIAINSIASDVTDSNGDAVLMLPTGPWVIEAGAQAVPMTMPAAPFTLPITVAVTEMPIDLADVLFWHDASKAVLDGNNRVSEWTDLSGKDNHSQQTTEALRPTRIDQGVGGGAVVSFDASDPNWLQNVANIDFAGNSAYTIAVYYRRMRAGSGGPIFKRDANDSGGRGWMVLHTAGLTVTRWYLRFSVSLRNEVSIPISPIDQWVTRIWSKPTSVSALDLDIYEDGIAATPTIDNNTMNTASTANAEPLVVGAETQSGWNFDGEMAEIMLINRALTPQEAADLHEWFLTNPRSVGPPCCLLNQKSPPMPFSAADCADQPKSWSGSVPFPADCEAHESFYFPFPGDCP